jgi:ribosome-associated protein
MPSISDTITIPDFELTWTYARSGGPGGQNVNKVASKVQLRWAIGSNTSIPPDAKERLRQKHPSKFTSDGGFLITAQESRDQIRNKEIAMTKLLELIRKALVTPKKRRATTPTKASKTRRLKEKKAVGQRRENRRVSHFE